jgi:hypothetical protein
VAKVERRPLSNTEVVVLAVYVLGGERRAIDTEDLAVKVNEIAPGRFAWRKYPDQINLELVRVYASDAKKVAKGALLTGSGNEGWRLTTAGLVWARRHAKSIQGTTFARNRTRQHDKAHKAERARLLVTEAFAKVRNGHSDEVTAREVEIFFRLDPYVSPEKRAERISRVCTSFRYDPELGPIVEKLAAKLRGENEQHQ